VLPELTPEVSHVLVAETITLDRWRGHARLVQKHVPPHPPAPTPTVLRVQWLSDSRKKNARLPLEPYLLPDTPLSPYVSSSHATTSVTPLSQQVNQQPGTVPTQHRQEPGQEIAAVEGGSTGGERGLVSAAGSVIRIEETTRGAARALATRETCTYRTSVMHKLLPPEHPTCSFKSPGLLRPPLEATHQGGVRVEVRSAHPTTTGGWGMARVPDETLLKCLSLLSFKHRVVASAVCRRFKKIVAQNLVVDARIMTFNLRNNGENKFRKVQTGSGIRSWERRSAVVAQILQRERPTVLCLQEDSFEMLTTLFSHQQMFSSQYQVFPPLGGCRRKAVPSGPTSNQTNLAHDLTNDMSRKGAKPEANTRRNTDDAGPSRELIRWEQCSIMWDDTVFELQEGGQYEWVDDRSDHVWHMIPFTWVLLRVKSGDESSNCMMLVCNTHLQAGHDYLRDV